MQDPAYELRRINLPRTPLKKGLTSWERRPMHGTPFRSTLETVAGFFRTSYLGASVVADVGGAAGAAPLGRTLFGALLRSA
jgi:hypothetical protein